ncbi:hypothetical protein CROQUDRAFT_692636 [Cronartium quercuum f. sp. fusiforme G11]|uniref:Lysophospholipase n=1 Tax=Cronartium quercuum f. sp. fusiforme G11 TaxID=708437 RepID=A0A9P6TFF3_9BASI|nr:hypothetical protein CROQUDRAFT_692636 [Cronartium quercuum f. sp. fusiforme G11]
MIIGRNQKARNYQIKSLITIVTLIHILGNKLIQIDGLLIRRSTAIENSPSGNYAPSWVNCPNNFTNLIGEKESNYVRTKTIKSIPLWKSYLSRAELTDFDLNSFLSINNPIQGETLPNIGLAISGGGIRALIGCAGILNGFDNRNQQANEAGTGGILQLSNYITGLSGGSWLVGSWATSDFPTFTELNQTVWNLTEDNGYISWNSIKRYPKAIKQAKSKSKAGFPASLVDLQAYILSHHLIIPDPTGPFTEKGLNKRPSFFGCYEPLAPLVIYFPNYFVLANTKMATMKADYTVSEINGFFENSFAIATQISSQSTNSNGFVVDDYLNPMFDRIGSIPKTQWKTCLACALIDRQILRNHKNRTPQCHACFEKYCS